MSFFTLLETPLNLLADPSRRLFWGFILSSIIIIFISWVWQKKRISWRRIKCTFFAKDYWFTRSTATDVSLLFLNTALRLVLLVPLFGSHLLGTIWVAKQLQINFGTAPNVALPLFVIALIYAVIFFIIEDLSRFLLHMCMHKSAFLWRFHKTHHSAPTLTPLTLHRVHPVEMTLYFVRGLVVFSLVSGVFIYLFGNKLTTFHILGVDALGFMFNALGANLRHSHIHIGFGRLEKIFISPAQHQIHHSRDIAHRDKNFGSALSIWDRLAASWIKSNKRDKLTFGLTQPARPNASAIKNNKVFEIGTNG